MDLNFSAFQEPRGVMRAIQFIFSICAFATITSYSGEATLKCKAPDTVQYDISYPFNMFYKHNTSAECSVTVSGDFSSDARFFVATGVLAMLYTIGIIFVYAKYDESYRTNSQLPLIDFVITVIFGVLWLSSSAAWANGLTGLKDILNINTCSCQISVNSYSTLNISVIFGFLNFFLWAADLWFLYKETAWFQGNQPPTSGGVTI